jgi:hypothetical protein
VTNSFYEIINKTQAFINSKCNKMSLGREATNATNKFKNKQQRVALSKVRDLCIWIPFECVLMAPLLFVRATLGLPSSNADGAVFSRGEENDCAVELTSSTTGMVNVSWLSTGCWLMPEVILIN